MVTKDTGCGRNETEIGCLMGGTIDQITIE